MPHEPPPIACTLAPGEYIDRLRWINELARDALHTLERRDLELTLRFAPEAVERVRELVRREQACCGFLTFELEESSKEIRLTIRAPEEARIAANTIFALFVGSSTRGRRTMPAHESPASPEAQRNIAGRAAIAAAAGAVMCGVCFVLPSALPSVVLASAGSVVAWVGHAQWWVTAVAVIAVAGAWIRIWRQSVRVRARPASATLYLMGVATALLVLALVWPVIEPHIARVLGNL